MSRFQFQRFSLLSLIFVMGAPLYAQSDEFNDDLPKELIGVTIIEHLNEDVPLDLTFTDEDGKTVKLGDYFNGTQPVVLQMGYFRCPMLCGLVLNAAMDGLGDVEDLSAGKDFQLVAVSINPNESHELARIKKEGYLLEYNRPGASRGFHFLVGDAANTKALADAVGFQYRLQESGEYSHAAVLFVLTPDGRVSKYLYGVKYEPRTLRYALMEGAEGRIGTTLERFILWCHAYDPDRGGYVLLASRIMQLGGVVMVFVLVIGVGWLWLKDRDVARGRPRNGKSAPPIHTMKGHA